MREIIHTFFQFFSEGLRIIGLYFIFYWFIRIVRWIKLRLVVNGIFITDKRIINCINRLQSDIDRLQRLLDRK